jgi:hypothetical protein
MIARRIKPILLAAVATAALGSAASAAPLAPGNFISPAIGTTSTPDAGPVVGMISGSYLTPGGEFGTYTENVIKALGGLEFDTVVTDDPMSPGPLEALSFLSFKGFTTDVGYNPAHTTPGVFPGTFFRSPAGDTISVDFHPPLGSQIMPGQQVDVLIKTNATLFGPGVLGVIDGGTANSPILAPAVPEPGSLALLATGGLPLLGFLRRRIRKA